MRIPLPLSSDSYTISSNNFIGAKAKQKSIYNFTNRYSPNQTWPHIAKDSRMILWGLSYFIEKHLSQPVTADDVLETNYHMQKSHAFGGPMGFDFNLWMRVVKEYNGYLPVKIEALPEGSTFFVNEPVVKITSLDEDFGEIAGTLESRLLGTVSVGSSVATMCRHWLKHFQRQSNNDPFMVNMIHNFGSRACSTEEEDILTGVAHLLSFTGTDNFAASYYARKHGMSENIGNSVHALAHRTVMSHLTEEESFLAIMNNSAPQNIASYVADCYNYDNAVNTLTDMAIKYPEHTFVIRADSGLYVDVNEKIIQACIDKNLYSNNEKGIVPKNVRFIYGDSVNPQKADVILDMVEKRTGNRFAWGIFGVGGYIVNSSSRDTLSSAYKLAAIASNNQPVVKLSETPGKLSIGGNTYIYNTDFKCEPRVSIDHDQSVNSLMRIYYDATKYNLIMNQGPCIRDEELSNVRTRCLEDFDKWDTSCKENTEFGLNRTSLCEDIKGVQDDCYAKYK